MIPTFPNFKPLELSDRTSIESYTSKYAPYSDFNFTSLWAWDTEGKRQISELNGNLVVLFTDYHSGEPFLSFLGDNEQEKTSILLLEYCIKNGLPPILRLVPEISVENFQSLHLKFEDDNDNFDYIYSIRELTMMSGLKFQTKRGRSRKFSKENLDIRVETHDSIDKIIEETLEHILDVWELRKLEQHKEFNIEHERHCIKRLCNTFDSHNVRLTTVQASNETVAFSFDEVLPNKYSICHFWKADVAYVGVFDFLMQSKARLLYEDGIELINYEQDLGIDSLRRMKLSYRPVDYLKKYKIRSK